MSTHLTDQTSSSSSQQPARGSCRIAFEWLKTLTIIILLLGAAAWLAGGEKLLTRQLWMDEVHSWLLLTDQSQSHALSALADGADFNPPAWFLLTRWLSGDVSKATEIQIRILCLGWTVASIAGLTILLSARFPRWVVAGAIILTISQPLLIHHATEIRFYGFWTSCCIWICVVLQSQPARPDLTVARSFSLILLGGLVCTTHYFGVFSIGLILLPLAIKRNVGWLRDFTALSSGAVTGVCCSLFFLKGQRAALSRPTWISPATVSDSAGFLQSLMPAWQLFLCVVIVFISYRGMQELRRPSSQSRGSATGLWCLLALGCMPIVIVAVAWLLQPALVTRYAVVGLPAFAVIAAWCLHQCSPRVVAASIIVGVIGFALSVNHRAREWILEEELRLKTVQQIEEAESDLVIFEDRIVWMPIVHHYRQLASRCRLIDFPDSELLRDSSLRIVQRDAGRRIQRWYPEYQLTMLSELQSYPRYYVVPYAGDDLSHLAYPAGYESLQCSDVLFLQTLQGADNQGKHGVTENRKEKF